jgi:hypothetical protein
MVESLLELWLGQLGIRVDAGLLGGANPEGQRTVDDSTGEDFYPA